MPDVLDDDILIQRRLKVPIRLNDFDEPGSIAADEVAVLDNAVLNRLGRRDKRAGISQIADDLGSNFIQGLAPYYKEGDSTLRLIMVTGGVLHDWTGTGNWSAALASGLNATDRFTILTALDLSFIIGPNDNVRTYDGTTVTDEGNTNTDPPRGRMAITIQNRLLISGADSNRSWVFFSDSLAPQTFDRTANAIKIEDADNQINRAMVEYSLTDTQGFVVFKDSSYHFVDVTAGFGSAKVFKMNSNVGCIASRSAVRVGDDILWLSREGTKYRVRSLRRTQQDKLTTFGVVSDAVENELSDINDAHAAKAAAIFFDNKYILAFPTGSSTTNDRIVVLDLKESNRQTGQFSWSVWKGWAPAVFAPYIVSSAEGLYYGEASADSVVFEALTGNSDNATGITYTEEGRREDFDLPEDDKVFRWVEVFFLATDDTEVTISAQIEGLGYTELGTVNLSGTGPVLPINLPFTLSGQAKRRKKFPLDALGPGRDCQIKVEQSDDSTDLTYLGYIMSANQEDASLGDD